MSKVPISYPNALPPYCKNSQEYPMHVDCSKACIDLALKSEHVEEANAAIREYAESCLEAERILNAAAVKLATILQKYIK